MPSKLDTILADAFSPVSKGIDNLDEFKQRIKDVVLELIGDMEYRHTSDMTLGNWSPDDYKAFGHNETKIALKQKIAAL